MSLPLCLVVDVGVNGESPICGEAPIEPSLCIPTHLDDTFWLGESGWEWNAGLNRWDMSEIDSSVFLTPIGGWNTPTFRPTKAFVTLIAPDASIFPITSDIIILVTGFDLIGSEEAIFENAFSVVTLEIDLDWTEVVPESSILRLTASNDIYMQGPYITCLGFNL